MKLPQLFIPLLLVFVCLDTTVAQMRPMSSRARPRDAFVIDESLSLLRSKPSLFAPSVQRMRRGRRVRILGSTEADGVTFYRVTALRGYSGWLQADAVFVRGLKEDEERFARLVQAADGFEQIELTVAFLQMYPTSKLRPAMLLLFGDLLENASVKLSRDAGNRLSGRSMAASGAPVHSFYLNFSMLDRYRKLGVSFLFNSETRRFHYDGASWIEIRKRYPNTEVAAEAEKRLNALRERLSGKTKS